MKKFWLILSTVECLLLSGCAISGERYGIPYARINTWQQSIVAPIRQSDIPANPVLRRYRYYTDGQYTYSYNQGTDTYVSKSWDPYVGAPRVEIRQTTYKNVYENYTPRYYQPQMYYDTRGPKYSHIGLSR